MTITVQALAREIRPEKTSVLFGAGSSIPSGAPSALDLSESLVQRFKVEGSEGLKLSELSSIIELWSTRTQLIGFLREKLTKLKPTGGLLSIPIFPWRSIFTTNYDTLIEQSYSANKKELRVYSSNFDFSDDSPDNITSLYKLHGTISRDVCDGDKSRLILTEQDFELAKEYRELLYDRFLHHTSSLDFLVVGHSLADPDLDWSIKEAIRRKRQSGAPGRLFVLVYTTDVNRAVLLEQRGLIVCFAGLDDLTKELLNASAQSVPLFQQIGDLLDAAPSVRPSTIDVTHALTAETASAVRLFNGSPARFGDIQSDLVFLRDLTPTIAAQLTEGGKPTAVILGAAGVRKTTLGRQILSALSKLDLPCFEHRPDTQFDWEGWLAVAQKCATEGKVFGLLVDDCHLYLREIGRLVDAVAVKKLNTLRLILLSSKPQWTPRIKSPQIFVTSQLYDLSALSNSEINSLLDLFDRQRAISELVEPTFAGFSRFEKFRRLRDRCSADMFVCLKNIFATDKLDDIILSEFAELPAVLQNIYRTVSALEASGVHVHRQLVIRVLGVSVNQITGIIQNLDGLISESTLDHYNGIYAWEGRHRVISEIIMKYKYHDQDELMALYDSVISAINPTYRIERFTLKDLCDYATGIGRIGDRSKQNYLLRRMISVAPAERVPRHRLIRNLIRSGQLEDASNEIRIFESEMTIDAPVVRYRAQILIERASGTPKLMTDDRLVILDDAAAVLRDGMYRFRDDRTLYAALCEVGLKRFELSGKWDLFDEAISDFRDAEARVLDPEFARLIVGFQSRADRLVKGH